MGYYPFILKDKTMSNRQYMHAYVQEILINLNKSMTYDIICYLLTTNFNLNIVGYNKNTNEFYGKKTKKGCCLLELNLKIIESTNNSTIIIITPIIGTHKDIVKFIENFNKKIYTYV